VLKRVMCAWGVILAGSLCHARAPAPGDENPKDYTTHVVGCAHIDMAWLGRWEESVHDITYNTFLNQLLSQRFRIRRMFCEIRTA
jgi:hypothetical protein